MVVYSKIEKQRINGAELYFSVSSHEDLTKPIILYLHGGPGDSCIPLTQKFNADLEQYFNFVNLEQRGSGRSYYKFDPSENLSIGLIVEDIYVFAQYLLTRFQQQQLIILGHSWGSVLGLKFIQAHPELVSKYIGIGQVVNMKKNITAQQNFLKEKGIAKETLAQLDFDNKLIESSLKLTKLIVKQGGSLAHEKNYQKLIRPYIFAKSYSFKALINRLRGSNQSVHYFWEELMAVDFETVREFAVPIYFLEGRQDRHVSSDLVQEYANAIRSTVTLIWFENSGHFPHWEEPEKFNQQVIELCTKS